MKLDRTLFKEVKALAGDGSREANKSEAGLAASLLL